MLEAVPLANVKTETCRDSIINQWVACFGMPAHLTSDQGAQFTSALWARTCDVIGIHHNTTTDDQRESPTEPSGALVAADLVYVCKGEQL